MTGDTYIAVLAGKPLTVNSQDQSNYVQEGTETYWITEIGTKKTCVSFDAFLEKVEQKKISYAKRVLTYESDHTYSVKYGGEFRLDGKVVDVDYPRFDTPYVRADRNSRSYEIEFDGKRLRLDFEKMDRIVE
jgi:hypothetical protein